MTTTKQKSAIKFCEDVLGVQFTGDIDNFQQVSNFLSLYLEKAKQNNITQYLVTDASAKTGTCILTNSKTGEEFEVKLDTWRWKNSFAAEIFFTFRGQKFSVVCDMEDNYPYDIL